MASQAWRNFASSKPPIPFSMVANLVTADDVDGMTETPLETGVTGAVSTTLNLSRDDDNRRGNPLTTFRLSEGAEHVVVLPKSRTLSSITAYMLQVGAPPMGICTIQKYASCNTQADVIANVDETVFHLESLQLSNNQYATLLAATSNTLSFAHLSQGELKWMDQLSVPDTRSATLNPLYPEEFTVLSADGLFCGTSDSYTKLRHGLTHPDVHDVQCISPSAQFRKVIYGVHPRTVLLSSRRSLLLHDMRTAKGRLNILELKDKTLARDGEIGAFCRAPNDNGFNIVLATRASLAYYDIRRPNVPLLGWSLVLPSAPDKISATALNPSGFRTDVVLLASSRWGHTEVFHALHTADRQELSPFHGLVDSEIFGLPTQEIVWSDLPVPISTTSPYQDCVDGLVAVRGANDRRAGVLQWSGRTGLTVHPFEVVFGEDAEVGVTEHCTRNRGDNSVNLRNSVWALGPYNKGNCTCDQYPVSRSNPGSYLHSRLKRLLLRDVRELRKRICCDEDDDADSTGPMYVPRPFMRDLFTIGRSLNNASKSLRSTPDKFLSRQGSPPRALPLGDDREDTVIGEAALLKSQESEDSDEPENNSTDILDEIGSGCLFHELSRSARSGFGHSAMPIGIAALKEAVLGSPLINSYEPVWHAACDGLHDANSTAVSTAAALPDWMCTTVYYTEEAEKGESRRSSSIPDSSQYGKLLSRMQEEFFE